jgi:hypothetical protein
VIFLPRSKFASPFFRAGLQNPITQQIKLLAGGVGEVGAVGKVGKNLPAMETGIANHT